MNRLLITTAALGLVGSMAVAEQHTSDTSGASSAAMSDMQGELIRTTDITGAPIYTFNEAQDEGWDPDFTYDAVGGDWNQVGTISDVVLDQSGNLRGFVAEIGGFLDIGDKDVLISVEDANLVAAEEYAWVTRLNEEDLESLQGVGDDFWD
ncbi:PRC-barrel domain-containing protein [Roseivivax marinus]|uniref:PRC-barrel domain-containing protein n=1 Tax=Roseivivax marinus TaxID=1379903 RepID=UPI0008CB13FB|nr:PRC-barrel domain-containing protein [Roseivivax marinus]SEL46536.1 PRC-barrel domain-containing protein [Roseivivax marinus]